MNYSTAIFLISDDVRAVLCSYDKDSDGRPIKIQMYKTLNPDIEVGDYVVVPTETRHGMTVVKVVDTEDIEPDFDSGAQVNWIIGVVDRADHEALKAQEDDAIARIKSAEKRKKRDELRASLIADANGALKVLPIYTLDDKPDAEPAPDEK